ncbi:hypothetical protein KXD93_15105 [Mucilaginibacter sp. BJC16-A38]|uniref:DUF6630 family protein n=1 Tax=Mucilaginibacter phenanthrenivorans TaxID=1234842 RepID=UPI0021583A7C|nr:hypothetical protein [Mucilaginibacter phenanthrenivorans]MCR8558984.1 hypothetical protein [Mucilaginibacter phenanthrenivorans]
MKIKITAKLILAIIVLSIAILIGIVYLFGILIKSLSTTWVTIIFITMMVTALVYDLVIKKRKSTEQQDFLNETEHLLGDSYAEFIAFKNLYARNLKAFRIQNDELIKSNNQFDFKDLKPIEILYLFASSKNLVYMTDWKGEENEYEIEAFLETLLKKPVWKNAAAFRNNLSNKKLRDEQFIIGLLKSLDKDLQTIDQRLIFLDLGWDAYVYMCINTKAYNQVMNKAPKFLHGVGKLR